MQDDLTIDPSPRAAVSSIRPTPRLEILFHSDLRRVGDATAPGLFAGGPVVIGRRGPDFGGAPLADPCISRRQLEISRRRGRFAVRALAGARRPLRLFGPGGEVVSAAAAPPGTWLAIGDRAALLLDAAAPEPGGALGIIGRAAATRALRAQIRRVARLGESALVVGETGTGKELIARALHAESGREGALVAVNCAALPEALVEGQLFGHTRGAFTGAQGPSAGLIRSAHRGTLFLDEIAELAPPVQAKLLRVIQEREVRAVGATDARSVDLFLVAATHRDLAAEVRAGRFREDLYGRLEAPVVTSPPLRDRREDIPRLFAHFLQARAAAVPHLIRAADERPPPIPLEYLLGLLRERWPRNVRQLQQRVTALAVANAEPGPFAAPEAAPQAPAPAAPAGTASAGQRVRFEDMNAERLLAALEEHDFVQRRLASALGISRTTLGKWMQTLGIRRPGDVPEEELRAALDAAGGDVAAAARALRISERGLALRLSEGS